MAAGEGWGSQISPNLGLGAHETKPFLLFWEGKVAVQEGGNSPGWR